MNQTKTFEKLKIFLDHHLNQSTNDRVAVFPIRCGMGKSKYVNYLISNYIRNRISDTIHNNSNGLIIVTDSIDRMKDYLYDGTSDRRSNDREEKEKVFLDFLSRNRDNIAFLTTNTVTDEIKTQRKKKILMLTTQRFFNLSREEIIAFTKYAGGKRTKIIFDEKPFLIEHRQLDIKTFNDIDSALHQTIDDSVDFAEKAWIINQWENFREKIQSVMTDYEQQNASQLEIWYYKKDATVTDDDDRFFKFIDRHRQKLNQFKPSICTDIYVIKQLIAEGATFISQKIRSGRDYLNYFIVTVDNSSKLLNLGADVFVLDGTADIDPIYKQHYVHMVDCHDFNVPLDNLTINIVDIPSSKNQIGKSSARHNSIISFVKKYLLADPEKPNVVFTYKEIADCFKDSFEHVHHFGAIKGLNDFMDSTSIAQVGLNRFPDQIYRQIAFFTKLSEHDYNNKTVVRLIEKQAVENVMNHALLTDIEQNMFRSKIRNTECNEPVCYTIFFNHDTYAGLIDLIKERYGTLGATINEIQTPTEFKMQKSLDRNTSHKTNRQVFLEWYNRQPNNRYFKTSEMLKECGLSLEQFRTVKKSDIVKEILSTMKTCVRGEYLVRR